MATDHVEGSAENNRKSMHGPGLTPIALMSKAKASAVWKKIDTFWRHMCWH